LFLLVHPGGPFWKNKDLNAWSIPKGEIEENEEPLKTALREFKEETGKELKADKIIPLKPVKLKGGKTVYAWAVEGDFDPAKLKSNTIEIKWPPKTNRHLIIPEVDKAAWFTAEQAKEKINKAQYALIEDLLEKIH